MKTGRKTGAAWRRLLTWGATAPFLAVSLFLGQAQAQEAEDGYLNLVAYWNFDNGAEIDDDAVITDEVAKIEGLIEGTILSTEGRTGEDGDNAIDLGEEPDGQIIIDAIEDEDFFLKPASDFDKLTVVFWQKLHKVQNSSTFWFGAGSAGSNNRNAQAHVPWGNNAIYFDTAGCCNGGTQRINKGWSNAEFMKWHHYTFVKDGPEKRIYIDGNLWHSGRNTLALKSDWNRATIGAEHNGGNKTPGILDDFAVFASALTEAEIKELAAGTKPGDLEDRKYTFPRVVNFSGNMGGFTLNINDITRGGSIKADPDSVSATFDGESAELAVSKDGNVTSVSHSTASPLAPGSEHTVVLTFKDTEGNEGSSEHIFSVSNYGLIKGAYAVNEGDVDKSESGWLVNTTQISQGQGVGELHGNQIVNAEKQVNGGYIDQSTEEPYLNEADPDAFEGWSYYYMTSEVINFNQDAPNNVGNFTSANGYEDLEIPGIPGWGDSTDGIASEFLTYAYLKKGAYTFGVNSDDGFKFSSGADFLDQSAGLGQFNGGRGANDTIFKVYVEADGYYPIRVLWFEGGGGANVEVFHVDASGNKILFNDPDNENAIKCYVVGGVPIEESTTDRPSTGKSFLASLTPAAGDKLVKTKIVTGVIVDGEKAKVDKSSIKITVDGVAVNVDVSSSDGKVTATGGPDGGFSIGEHTATFAFTSGGVESVSEWSFIVPKVYTPAGAPPAEPMGIMNVREYHGIGTTSLSTLFAQAKFPDSPDFEGYAGYFEWPQSGDIEVNPAGNVRDNYGWHMMGYIYPPETGEYKFAVATDDNSELWLSTDSDPANAVKITQESTWVGVRSFQPESDETTSAPVFLEKGKVYFIECFAKEGGGGDNMAVAWSLPSDEGEDVPAGSLPISGEYISPLIPAVADAVDLTITTQPGDLSAEKNTNPQFSIELSHPDAGAQIYWLVNGAMTTQGNTLTLPEVQDDLDGAKIKAMIIYNGVLYSDEVTLSVTPDKTAPGIVSTDGSRFMNSLTVVYNEDVDEDSAGDAGNYSVSGLSIDSAEVMGRKVVLYTADHDAGKVYTLKINGVEDLAGNSLNTSVDIQAYVESTGYLWWDYYGGIGGAHPMENLTDNEKYPDSPDKSMLLPWLHTRWATGFQNNSHDNYGARASGWLVAPEDGEYRIFLRSDDHGQVWISSDEDPENVELIAEETGCCKGFQVDDGGLSGLVELEAGQKYYFEALLKEGGGGDWMVVGWRRPSEEADFDTPPWNDGGISGRHFVNYIPAGGHGFTGDADIYSADSTPGTGEGLTVREFQGIGGGRLGDLFEHSKWPNSPDLVETASYFEWPQSGNIEEKPAGNVADNYAMHMLGYVHPPETGEYQFFVASDDSTVLYLSTDEDPANKNLIAMEPFWNGVREFAQGRNRTTVDIESGLKINGSAPVKLEKGKAYFIEAITKEGGGGDNLAVTWIQAGDDYPADGALPIAGEHLSPWLAAEVDDTPPTLSVVRNADGTVTMTFEGTLQTAPTVNGPWTDVNGESPLTIPADEAAAFGRAKK